jgi:phosphate starvation-inducible PhoH-like protein
MAATHAANLFTGKEINKIIITRPNVSVGKDLGYFPGSLEEKFSPWVAPIVDVLKEKMGPAFDNAVKNGSIEFVPISVMRGRSFKNAFIIVDEAQNTTIPEMKMVLTRVGENCRVVINGDIKQSDIQQSSGLSKIIHLVKKGGMDVPIIEFTVDDIVRSEICKRWIVAFEGEGL